MPSLPIGMMLAWTMWKKKFIRGIFSGGIEIKSNAALTTRKVIVFRNADNA